MTTDKVDREIAMKGLEVAVKGVGVSIAYLPFVAMKYAGIFLIGVAALLLVCHFIGWI